MLTISKFDKILQETEDICFSCKFSITGPLSVFFSSRITIEFGSQKVTFTAQ
jgi:hypothetical protein